MSSCHGGLKNMVLEFTKLEYQKKWYIPNNFRNSVLMLKISKIDGIGPFWPLFLYANISLSSISPYRGKRAKLRLTGKYLSNQASVSHFHREGKPIACSLVCQELGGPSLGLTISAFTRNGLELLCFMRILRFLGLILFYSNFIHVHFN